MSIPAKLLYLGAAGEHYVMSECFRHDREAFKLPIDRGFDLVVTNACKHLSFPASTIGASQQPALDEIPLYLQVKSRQVQPKQAPNENRPRWEGSFSIKESDLSLICNTPNAALACVLFIDASDQLSKSRTTYAWWMSSAHVKRLYESGHFIKTNNPDLRELWIRFSEPVSDKTQAQNTYVSLFKQDQRKEAAVGDRSSGEMIPKNCFDFGKLCWVNSPA
ncbi:hypothetical protein PQQ53_34690 [Paraburkholderia strydomiana]|jgi:hypothetical protein|uniref:DUF4365 domain-containing protein n=1 Tax=Paraburkholderia strydomiana TaxID=1245417 RepID=A0ABW9EGF5_9BURK